MPYLYKEESYKLVGLAMQLHSELGCGFKEKVYQDAFEVLLKENNVPYEREKHISIHYHGILLEHDFFYDFLCYEQIGIELKAVSSISGEFQAQIINYLCVGNHDLGVIFNFGRQSLEYQWFPNLKKL